MSSDKTVAVEIAVLDGSSKPLPDPLEVKHRVVIASEEQFTNFNGNADSKESCVADKNENVRENGKDTPHDVTVSSIDSVKDHLEGASEELTNCLSNVQLNASGQSVIVSNGYNEITTTRQQAETNDISSDTESDQETDDEGIERDSEDTDEYPLGPSYSMHHQIVLQARKLKRVDYSRTPIKFELTPYEILMKDIRSRRHELKKIMIDGDIPQRVKKLSPLKRGLTLREQLFESMKKERILRPTTKFKDTFFTLVQNEAPKSRREDLRPRRLIIVDFSVLQPIDGDDEDEDDDMGMSTCGAEHLLGPPGTQSVPQSRPASRKSRMSLSLEEIVHMRSVLTKVKLETLPVEDRVREDVEKRKDMHNLILYMLKVNPMERPYIYSVIEKVQDYITKLENRV